jgi:Uncharacterized protein, 4-oxalocrotonate tautomerase homolog
MPFVNLKLVKNQVSKEQKSKIIEGVTDLITNIMGRERSLTVITIDELEKSIGLLGAKA